MAKRVANWIVPVLAIALLLLVVLWMAGLFSSRIEPATVALTSASTSDLWRVESQSVSLTESVPATLEARQSTDISSRILARIENIEVRSGDMVERGQVLISLEQSDLRSRTAQALESIKAAEARLTEATKNYERATSLRQQGLIAQADLDRALANRDALLADQAAAQQVLQEAETALSYAEIRAPISGRVIDRFAEPGDTAVPGIKLLSLYNPMSLRVEAHVRERLALTLLAGQAMRVEIPSLSRTVAAEIEELVPAAEPGSRSFLIKARLEYDAQMLPGMYARLEIPAGSEQQIRIPLERVASLGQLNLVWVERDGVAERRFVKLGPSQAGMVQVLAGLDEGDLLRPPPRTLLQEP
ncbi:efflux RND transporter periplasmic adaptor subunit [Halieaceae bacterium IMCC14734]|uniref:Efflux RND transporter periplasmic adaptor subunit n=1 Tax=Candidatus Litorirhabdus singularis TaxID=2518993 RepID=A0ABT3TE47_9GAMM|nr:efflux RND transporter periplasmic adaptor subunit [Candidatus Litorirhabdus singularis]MCX2979694.1 efflux RND transporter periplasmic adaptor subunit [Candidatus Litorirhabdus singularis]